MNLNKFELEMIFNLTFGKKIQETAKELNFAGNSFKHRAKVNRQIGEVIINDNLSANLWEQILKQKINEISSEEQEEDILMDWKKFDIETNSNNQVYKPIQGSQGQFSTGVWKKYLEQFLPGNTFITADFQTKEELILEIKKDKNVIWIKLPRFLNLEGIFKKGGNMYIAKWQLNESLYETTGEIELFHPYGVILRKVFNDQIIEILDKTEQKEKTPAFIQNAINELILNKNVSEEDEGLFEYINYNTNDYAINQTKSLISISNSTKPIKGVALVSSSVNRPYKTNQLSANAVIELVDNKFTIKTNNENVFATYHTKEQLQNVFEIKSSGKRNSNTIKATCDYAYPQYVADFKVNKKF